MKSAATSWKSIRNDPELLEIVGLIYEAVLGRGAGPELARRLAERLQARALFFAAFAPGSGADLFHSVHGVTEQQYGDWLSRFSRPSANPWARGARRYPPCQVLSSAMICSEAELASSELFVELLGPLGLHQIMGVDVVRDLELTANVSVYRSRHETPFGEEDFRRLRPLIPHFWSAARLWLGRWKSDLAGGRGARAHDV